MKIIYNKIIPFKGFKAMYFFGVLFVRKECIMYAQDLRHEKIHHEQAKELLYVFFYLWYVIEWLIRCFIMGWHGAYKTLSFEREAYANQRCYTYLKTRKKFAFLKYMKI